MADLLRGQLTRLHDQAALAGRMAAIWRDYESRQIDVETCESLMGDAVDELDVLAGG